ncbi:hypothetical protein [uncultured Roseobacter sp.]|nr:hypothetical protein [uncultured Roseobacter sp.]
MRQVLKERTLPEQAPFDPVPQLHVELLQIGKKSLVVSGFWRFARV